MEPDLANYDVILVNTSAGKDSQAMLDYLYELAVGYGVVDRLVTVHADLGKTPRGHDVEWPGTAELAEEQAAHYGLRFIKVARPQGGLLQQIQARGMWPSSAARYCTSDQKRGQVRKVMTQLAAEQRAPGERAHGRRARILNCLGLRREESPARRKKQELVIDELGPNGKYRGASNLTKRQVDEWLPIVDWTEAEVWERIRSAGTRHHPAYDLGMPRLSCSLCVLASRPALVRAAQLRPELADEYVDTEVAMGHTFTATFSIADIVAEAAATETPVTIPNWNA